MSRELYSQPNLDANILTNGDMIGTNNWQHQITPLAAGKPDVQDTKPDTGNSHLPSFDILPHQGQKQTDHPAPGHTGKEHPGHEHPLPSHTYHAKGAVHHWHGHKLQIHHGHLPTHHGHAGDAHQTQPGGAHHAGEHQAQAHQDHLLHPQPAHLLRPDQPHSGTVEQKPGTVEQRPGSISHDWHTRVTMPGTEFGGDASLTPRHHLGTYVPHGSAIFESLAPAGGAWTEQVLKSTIADLQGKSPQTLEAGIDPRLGCARCVTQFGHRAYGLPITDSVANLESSMQARNFERVPLNAETMAHMQPGDIIVGHRTARPGEGPLHGHTAVYMGNGQVFNNNAIERKMIAEPLGIFQKPLYDGTGRLHMNGFSDVWIYRPRSVAA